VFTAWQKYSSNIEANTSVLTRSRCNVHYIQTTTVKWRLSLTAVWDHVHRQTDWYQAVAVIASSLYKEVILICDSLLQYCRWLPCCHPQHSFRICWPVRHFYKFKTDGHQLVEAPTHNAPVSALISAGCSCILFRNFGTVLQILLLTNSSAYCTLFTCKVSNSGLL